MFDDVVVFSHGRADEERSAGARRARAPRRRVGGRADSRGWHRDLPRGSKRVRVERRAGARVEFQERHRGRRRIRPSVAFDRGSSGRSGGRRRAQRVARVPHVDEGGGVQGSGGVQDFDAGHRHAPRVRLLRHRSLRTTNRPSAGQRRTRRGASGRVVAGRRVRLGVQHGRPRRCHAAHALWAVHDGLEVRGETPDDAGGLERRVCKVQRVARVQKDKHVDEIGRLQVHLLDGVGTQAVGPAAGRVLRPALGVLRRQTLGHA